jgi:cold shock CspA family protein/uncharacterized LabA/DUF88 family protein
MENITNLLRIGIFYDGYYFYKVSNYYKYEHRRKARISISGLQEFIRNEVAQLSGADIRRCRIVDTHYFKGRSSAKAMGDKVQNERVFEDILMRENIVTHYLPLRYGENNSLQEKGIDVWLALEAYELAQYKRFDILVLIAGDGDYLPLVRKLNILGTLVMLVSWDFSYLNENGLIEQTRTSQQLLEEVFYPIPMAERIDGSPGDEYVKNLFVPEKYSDEHRGVPEERPGGPPAPGGEAAAPEMGPGPGGEALGPGAGGDVPGEGAAGMDMITGVYADAGKEYYTSVIQSVKDGYGFIEDRQCNNVFFHFSTLENMDFNDLKPGLRVRYQREEDHERSKKEEGPRYRALKVSVIG